MEVISSILTVLFYGLLLAIQYVLSKSGNRLLGLIVPILLVVSVSYMYQTNMIRIGLLPTILMTVVGLLFLYGEWHRAQAHRNNDNS
ncbi:hypothetical protein [Staphylococcus massiliensis]|uniref:Uncharacterized protein n=1 Tax=Staphylococcus massiliensis S46 TaxID=1229783 RepID=K9B5P2_9STAP|nr:hypothetical protein [Staphylococcus massiliensis]EKU50152.1 hypothetical protein C273_02758 [Staphylococcus massiliensis S46]MCG3399623.1 hypothetical protein [Staphylococcus massiliensis]MCG3402134.1 hypothetical protein [Staphylococcus massiliensis]MCG3413296.1 hypothetical protein [Staphylococcus massiliensis]POA00847.1 hypothetical protein CD133_03400 [Staphylococcus massiliensis CCUG 55927]